MKASIQIILFMWLCLSVITVRGHDNETLFNVVNLQSQAEQEIPNNQMTVILATEHEGSDASRISATVNQDMQWALERIKQHDFVDSQTRNYQTYPVYNKNVITGWRALQQIEIKSENTAGLSKLVGDLQERLQVKQMSFSVTDAARKRFEDDLIEKALQAFNERIELIKNHMAGNKHRIVNININSGGTQPPISFARNDRAMSTMESTPAVEAGTSTLTVTVHGSVQYY